MKFGITIIGTRAPGRVRVAGGEALCRFPTPTLSSPFEAKYAQHTHTHTITLHIVSEFMNENTSATTPHDFVEMTSGSPKRGFVACSLLCVCRRKKTEPEAHTPQFSSLESECVFRSCLQRKKALSLAIFAPNKSAPTELPVRDPCCRFGHPRRP